MTTLDTQKLYIDGKFYTSANPTFFNNYSPSTGQKICQVHGTSDSDVNYAVESAHKAFKSWSRLTGAYRGKILWKAAQILRERTESLAQLEVLDTGKPISEARAVDVSSAADALEYFAGLAPSLHGQHVDLGLSFAYTRREALGVCAGIGAWNYPLQIACWKLAPALACGNTMVFKPSELTPLTALKLAEILSEAGLPDGVFNVIQGSAQVGEALVTHPKIRKVSLTGSVPTGKKILKTVAHKIIPVTLELGGKSPLLIFADAKLDQAVNAAMLANFYTQGEICSNGTRVFVEDAIYDQFIENLLTNVKKLKVGNPFDQATHMGAVISREHKEKILTSIRQGETEGAKLLYGGKSVQVSEPCQDGYFLSPTIFTECTDTMSIVKEEIFGPVMSVLRFKSEEEVLQRANDTPYGLAAGIFTQDIQRAHRLVAQLEAGICWINNYNITPVEVPFGAYKFSGLGRENGLAALEYYTQLKTVYVEMGEVATYP